MADKKAYYTAQRKNAVKTMSSSFGPKGPGSNAIQSAGDIAKKIYGKLGKSDTQLWTDSYTTQGDLKKVPKGGR
jgi:hypothetical protein